MPGQCWGVSPAGMVLSVLVILLLSVLYEAVKMGKAVLLRRALLALPRSLSQETLSQPQDGDRDPAQGRYNRDTPGGLRDGSGQHRGEKGCEQELLRGVYSLGRWLQGQPSPSRSSGRCPGWWLEAHVPLQEPLWVQEGAAGLGMGTSSNSVPTSLALAVPSFGAKPWILPLVFNPRSFPRLLLLILEQDSPLSCCLQPPPPSLLPKPPSGHSRLLLGGDSSCPSPWLMAFPISFPRWFWFHVGQTLFHVVQVVLGYMVMLAVMSYNAWIFLGAIAGSTLGYFMVYPLLGRG